VNKDVIQTRALERILAGLPENKNDLGNAVGEILFNEQSIKWSEYGYITSPLTLKDDMDLRKLINIIIYRNTGTKKEIYQAYEIIRPIFTILEPYVMNRKLLKIHEQVLSKQRLTQYVAW